MQLHYCPCCSTCVSLTTVSAYGPFTVTCDSTPHMTYRPVSWWRHQMETFPALLAICAQRPLTRSFDVFFDLSLNKRLSKQSWGWWFEAPPRPLWRHFNDFTMITWIKGGVINDAFLHWLNTDSERMKWSTHELWLRLWFTIEITSWWARWRLKSPTSRLFIQKFVQAQIKEIIKAPSHWPLWGEFTGDGEFPAQKASNVETIWWQFVDVIIRR